MLVRGMKIGRNFCGKSLLRNIFSWSSQGEFKSKKPIPEKLCPRFL
jgi:hypothetical protein